MANTYQGKFPVKDTGGDGFAGIAPVPLFPRTVMDSTKLAETFGSGLAIGIVRTTTRSWRERATLREIHEGPNRHWILPSPE